MRQLVLMTVVIVGSSVGIAAQNTTKDPDLFLVTGMPSNYGPETYPSQILKVNHPGEPLTLVRTVVPRSPGIYAVLDDLNGTLAVAYPHISPTHIAQIQESEPMKATDSDFDPEGRTCQDELTGIVEHNNGEDYAVFALTPTPDSKIGSALIGVKLDKGSTAGSVINESPSEYGRLRYGGVTGGPQYTITFYAKADGGKVLVPTPGGDVLLDALPPDLGKLLNGKRLAILGASARFLVFCVSQDQDQLQGQATRELFVHDRTLSKWARLTQLGNLSRTRFFSPWLETIEQQSGDLATDEHSERSGESAQIRGLYESYQGSISLIPGVLVLDNLVDGRRVIIRTNQEDSEVLLATDSDVVYRVNDTLYSATIKGISLTNVELVAKGPEIPMVHWAFR